MGQYEQKWKGFLFVRNGLSVETSLALVEGASQKQTYFLKAAEKDEGNHQRFINKPTMLPTLCSFLPNEKMVLYLQFCDVASPKFP